jgi:hypothetical protein
VLYFINVQLIRQVYPKLMEEPQTL